MLVALACVLALAAAPVPQDNSENGKALKALQGKWKVVAAEEKGEAGKVEDFDLQTIVVKGDRLAEVNKRGDETTGYGIKLDPSKSPNHIDLIWLDEKGQLTRRVAHAIYKLDGDRLTICFGSNISPDEPDDRPKEFKSGPPKERPQKGKLMYTFERVKE